MSDWPNNAPRLVLSSLALFWEHAWPKLWPLAGITSLFLVFALLDLFPVLPGSLHATILVGFAGALIWALWRGITSLRLPDGAEGQRRLERLPRVRRGRRGPGLDPPGVQGPPPLAPGPRRS